MSLGERITAAIEGSGKGKSQIARECGVTPGAVSQWPDAKSLRAETILLLEAATGYRAFWMMFGKGPRKLNEPQPVAWPFQKIELSRVLALSPEDRTFVEGGLAQILRDVEVSAKTPDETSVTQPDKYSALRGAKQARQRGALPPIEDGSNEVRGNRRAPRGKRG